MLDDNTEVIDKTFGQFDVNICRRRRNHKEQLVVREDTLTFETAIVFDARPTPRQLANMYMSNNVKQ